MDQRLFQFMEEVTLVEPPPDGRKLYSDTDVLCDVIHDSDIKRMEAYQEEIQILHEMHDILEYKILSDKMVFVTMDVVIHTIKSDSKSSFDCTRNTGEFCLLNKNQFVGEFDFMPLTYCTPENAYPKFKEALINQKRTLLELEADIIYLNKQLLIMKNELSMACDGIEEEGSLPLNQF